MTTNDGTPMKATNEPWKTPIRAPRPTAIRIARMPGNWWLVPGSWSHATVTPATPAT